MNKERILEMIQELNEKQNETIVKLLETLGGIL